jgi:hypothetical protein
VPINLSNCAEHSTLLCWLRNSRGLDPASVGSHVIFYYDKLSLPPPIGIKAANWMRISVSRLEMPSRP